MNIWSHLLGFLLFLVLMLYDNLIALPRLKGELSDHVVMTLGLICYQVRLPSYFNKVKGCAGMLEQKKKIINPGLISC